MAGRHEGGQHGRLPMMQPIPQPFEGFPQIADQIPPIEDVLGLGRASGGAARILRRAITTQNSVSGLVDIWSLAPNRAPASPPSASPRCCNAVVKRTVCCAAGRTICGRRSVKV
jgi:hypothetical protein